MFFTLAVMGFFYWLRERQRDLRIKAREQDIQEKRWAIEQQREDKRLEAEQARERDRLQLEERRLDYEREARYEARRVEEEKLTANAGTGSGGYIVMEMSEGERPIFHDLLKGFEDYAKLKGYHIAFSIDSSFEHRIAFKFTVKNDGVVVGAERVRQDFKEYIEKVRSGNIEQFDDIPVVTSIEEHDLVVTLLKNRITFLQHNYHLAQNATLYYQSLAFSQVRQFPALPTPNIIVQTGGTMDSRNYKAIGSSRMIQGESNTYTDTSVNINIGQSFNERQARITALDDVVGKLAKDDNQAEPVVKAQKELAKVRDELADEAEPDQSSVSKWLGNAKRLLGTAALGYEVTEAVKKLFEMFGA